MLFDGYSKLGLVLQVQLDNLKVLLENNQVAVVKLAHVQKRVAIETRGVSGRFCSRRTTVTDKYNNVVTMRTIVKPCDPTSPFYNCLGEVRAIYKNSLFLLFNKSPNQYLLRDKNNYCAFKAH